MTISTITIRFSWTTIKKSETMTFHCWCNIHPLSGTRFLAMTIKKSTTPTWQPYLWACSKWLHSNMSFQWLVLFTCTVHTHIRNRQSISPNDYWKIDTTLAWILKLSTLPTKSGNRFLSAIWKSTEKQFFATASVVSGTRLLSMT